MQMMGFLYCLKMVSTCGGVPLRRRSLCTWDPKDPSGRVTASSLLAR